MKAFRPRIDPRTVPRSRMLAQLGTQRPAVSIIALCGSQRAIAIEARIRNIPNSQIILACSGEATELPLGATVVRQRTDESTIGLINRASALALGQLLCILEPGETGTATWRDLVGSIEGVPLAWAGTFGSVPGRSLIARESLWTALRGLEEAFEDWEWTIHDFFRRARAIGFHVPLDAPPRNTDSADALLFRNRAALAPDRSTFHRSGPTSHGLTLYTAITNDYDTLKPQPAEAVSGIEQIAFLDEATAASYQSHSRGWRVTLMALSDSDPHRAARYPKINAHLALPETDYSLWVDASIGVVSPFPLNRLVDLFLGDCDICLFRHYARRSVFEEAEACKAYGLDRADVIDAQMARYRAEGLPENAGLIEAPIILRRHTDSIRRLNESWWDEIRRGSRRDQLSFNYVAWKLGLRYATFPLSLAAGNGLFVKFQRPNNRAA